MNILDILVIEIKKEKRTGSAFILVNAGILGALYAFANYSIRKEALLQLPVPPMDMLLTQLYGVILMMTLFGTIVAACMIYSIEFSGNAAEKLYTLPVSVTKTYFCKFIVLTVSLSLAVLIQNAAFLIIGRTSLPAGTFQMDTLLAFAFYSFTSSMPVLTFMLLIASRARNLWIPLGIGISGFLSGMALATMKTKLLLAHPFVIMLQPAVAMRARPDPAVILAATAESLIFLLLGLIMAREIPHV